MGTTRTKLLRRQRSFSGLDEEAARDVSFSYSSSAQGTKETRSGSNLSDNGPYLCSKRQLSRSCSWAWLITSLQVLRGFEASRPTLRRGGSPWFQTQRQESAIFPQRQVSNFVNEDGPCVNFVADSRLTGTGLSPRFPYFCDTNSVHCEISYRLCNGTGQINAKINQDKKH